jgi:hypothetical protein
MKTAAGRTRKIEAFVAMLAKGDTIVPRRADRTQAAAPGAAKRRTGTRGTKPRS